MVAETSLRDRRSRLLAQPGLQGQEFSRRYAAEADAWLSGLAERAAGNCPRHLALVAVGGYGRASLWPPATSMWCWSTTATGRSARLPTPSGTRSGTRVYTSTTRFAAPPRCSALPPRTCGWRSACWTAGWSGRPVAEPLLEKARAAWQGDRLGTRYLPLLEHQMADRQRRSRRRRVPARARYQREPRRPPRRQRAARPLGLRTAPAGVRRPGFPGECDSPPHRHPGRAAPPGPT